MGEIIICQMYHKFGLPAVLHSWFIVNRQLVHAAESGETNNLSLFHLSREIWACMKMLPSQVYTVQLCKALHCGLTHLS